MKTRDELVYVLREVAKFYYESPNMSDEFLVVWRNDGRDGRKDERIALDVDDFYHIAELLEEVPF